MSRDDPGHERAVFEDEAGNDGQEEEEKEVIALSESLAPYTAPLTFLSFVLTIPKE